MALKFLYGPFLLVIAAILIFSGEDGRRHLVLAIATGGAASFLMRFFHSGEEFAVLFMQAVAFPFLVIFTWLGLVLVAWIRSR